MKLIVVSFLGLMLVASTAFAQSGTDTLHSPKKYRNEKRNFCLNFKAGVSSTMGDPCDLRYGFLYAGDDWDWFQPSLSKGSRSLIKDLGELEWNSQFTVPVVEPLPKLAPGQERTISIDTSGRDGADGAPGKRGAPGAPGADADGVVRQPAPTPEPENQPPISTKKKNDGTPKIDPVFVKAIVGHMYVIHIVDDKNDFYALFRVEAIERGTSCLVSWKVIESPTVGSSEK